MDSRIFVLLTSGDESSGNFKEMLEGGNIVFTEAGDNVIISAVPDRFFKAVMMAGTQSLTFSNPLNIDFRQYATAYVTLTGDTTINIVGIYDGMVYRLKLIQGGTGNNLVTWGSGINNWPGGSPPTLATTIGHYDWITFITCGGVVSGGITSNFY